MHTTQQADRNSTFVSRMRCIWEVLRPCIALIFSLPCEHQIGHDRKLRPIVVLGSSVAGVSALPSFAEFVPFETSHKSRIPLP
jgi:hypothetical protein